MKSKMRTLEFRQKSKKGQMLSLDAAIAVFIFILILVFSFSQVNKQEVLPSIQLSRTGYDILGVLDYSNDLSKLDSSKISSTLDKTLPKNYDMRIRLKGTFPEMEIGSDLPENTFIVSGKRIFVTKSEGKVTGYGDAQFWIWLKN